MLGLPIPKIGWLGCGKFDSSAVGDANAEVTTNANDPNAVFKTVFMRTLPSS